MKWRKTNRAKRVDSGCANNGSCGVCAGNRAHQHERQSYGDEDLLDDLAMRDEQVHAEAS